MRNHPNTQPKPLWSALPGMILGLALALTLGGTAHAQTTALPAPWTQDWNEAIGRASKTQLPLLAMFASQWSPPCEEVQTELLPVKAVQDILRTNWVPVYVDEAKFPELHKRYQIRALPTFIVFNLQGGEHNRFVGSREPDDFLDKLQESYETMVELAQIGEALKKEPKNPYLHKALGDLLMDLGRFESAEDAYKRAKKYDSDNRTGARADLLFLDALEKANKKPKDGLKMFEDLRRKYPRSPRVADSLFITAMIEMEQNKNLERGQQFLELYLRKYPEGHFAEIAQQQLKTLKNKR